MTSVLTKSNIGKEDLSIQKNINTAETFKRKTSSGGEIDLTKFPDIWDGTGKINIASLNLANNSLVPIQYSGIEGSLGENVFYASSRRTGGYGAYGNVLSIYHVTAAVPADQLDVGMTSLVSSTNFTAIGAQNFGMWTGANTPSSEKSQTYTGGAAIGMEINVGNRWADFGLQTDIGGTRYTVGLQLVPDVVPSQDGATTNIYPGSFGLVLSYSLTGHKWWVGSLIRNDTIMATGHAHYEGGGSIAANAPQDHTALSGYWVNGFDFSGATFSNAVFKFGNNQVSITATAGGGQVVPENVWGYIIIDNQGTLAKIPFFKV